MKRLVLMGEGDGEREALLVLTKRLLPASAWEVLHLDPDVITLGDLPSLLSRNKQGDSDRAKWLLRLKHAIKRRNLGGVLTVLDGDAKRRVIGSTFCARDHARQLVSMARAEGAGAVFSLSIVFACKEFESWLIAGVESLAGQSLKHGLEGIKPGTVAPDADLEAAPRNAKGWLSDQMAAKYKPARDQAHLTSLVDFDLVRKRGMRSFTRLEHAISELAESFRTGNLVATPA
jgi:Domain of unknown function (DUF4276)